MNKEDYTGMRLVYILLLASSLVMFMFFNELRADLPAYGTGLFLLFWIIVAMDQSWQSWSKKGQIIITTLGECRGANDGYCPSGDWKMIASKNHATLTCIATGGFVFQGFSIHGNKNFLVVPPEHVQRFGANIIVRTNLQRTDYGELPKYIQEGLEQLPKFTPTLAKRKNNIWFGGFSSYYGDDTSENMTKENNFLIHNAEMNKLIESNKRLRALKYSDVPPEHVSILESVSDE